MESESSYGFKAEILQQMDEYNVNLSVQFSPDNKLVATASGEGHTQLKVWNNGIPTPSG